MGSQQVDGRADIYGLGAVLFQLLTGAPPFEGADSQEIVARHLSDPVPVASLSQDRVPAWLSGVVVRCMAKHPDDRYPSAGAVLHALREGRARSALPPAEAIAPAPAPAAPAPDDTPTESMRTSRRPRRWLRWVGVTAAGGIGAVAILVLLGSRAPPALVVENQLTEPIALTLGDTALTVLPGDSARIAVPRGRPLEANWAMVQPTSGGRILGEQLAGTIVAERVRGETRRVVTAGDEGGARFAPVVVNRSGRAVAITVVAGRDSVDCGCLVPDGDSIRLGYYRHPERGALRIADQAGWSARFTALDTLRDSASGRVLVRVDSVDLRAPMRRPPRASPQPPPPAAERRDPLGAFLPVR